MIRRVKDPIDKIKPQVPQETYSDWEAEQRAAAATRRLFETPYKPQKELVGKSRRRRSRAAKA